MYKTRRNYVKPFYFFLSVFSIASTIFSPAVSQAACIFELDIENGTTSELTISDVRYKLRKAGKYEDVLVLDKNRLKLNPGHSTNECKKNSLAKLNDASCDESGGIGVFNGVAACGKRVRWKFKYKCAGSNSSKTAESRAKNGRTKVTNTSSTSMIDAKITSCNGDVTFTN